MLMFSLHGGKAFVCDAQKSKHIGKKRKKTKTKPSQHDIFVFSSVTESCLTCSGNEGTSVPFKNTVSQGSSPQTMCTFSQLTQGRLAYKKIWWHLPIKTY